MTGAQEASRRVAARVKNDAASCSITNRLQNARLDPTSTVWKVSGVVVGDWFPNKLDEDSRDSDIETRTCLGPADDSQISSRSGLSHSILRRSVAIGCRTSMSGLPVSLIWRSCFCQK